MTDELELLRRLTPMIDPPSDLELADMWDRLGVPDRGDEPVGSAVRNRLSRRLLIVAAIVLVVFVGGETAFTMRAQERTSDADAPMGTAAVIGDRVDDPSPATDQQVTGGSAYSSGGSARFIAVGCHVESSDSLREASAAVVGRVDSIRHGDGGDDIVEFIIDESLRGVAVDGTFDVIVGQSTEAGFAIGDRYLVALSGIDHPIGDPVAYCATIEPWTAGRAAEWSEALR